MKPGLSSPARLSVLPAATICPTHVSINRSILSYYRLSVNSSVAYTLLIAIHLSYEPLHTVKAASPDKFPDKRIVRNILTRQPAGNNPGISAAASPPHTPALSRAIPKQQRLRIQLQHRQLIDQRRIEHHIRILLIREDVASPRLGAPNRHMAIVSCAEVPRGPCIPHDPAQQPSVGRRNPVVLINVQLGQRTDINLKFALPVAVRLSAASFRPVDPLDDQNIILSQRL